MSNFILVEDPENYEPDAEFEERIQLIMNRLRVSPASFSLLSTRFLGPFKTSPFEANYYPPSEDEDELDMVKRKDIQTHITVQQQVKIRHSVQVMKSPLVSGVKRKYPEIEVVTAATESPLQSGNEGSSSKEKFSGVLIQEEVQQPNNQASHSDPNLLYASNFPSTNSPEEPNDYEPVHSSRVIQSNKYTGSPELSLDEEDKIDLMANDELENKENLSAQKDVLSVIEIPDPSKPITLNTDSFGHSVDSVVEIGQPLEVPPALAQPVLITSRKSSRYRGLKWSHAELSDEDVYVERKEKYRLENNERFGSGIAEEWKSSKIGDPLISSGTFTSPTRTTNSVPRIDPKTPDRTYWNATLHAINSPQKTLRQISSPMTDLHPSPYQGIDIEKNVREIEAFLNKDVEQDGVNNSTEKLETSKKQILKTKEIE